MPLDLDPRIFNILVKNKGEILVMVPLELKYNLVVQMFYLV